MEMEKSTRCGDLLRYMGRKAESETSDDSALGDWINGLWFCQNNSQFPSIFIFIYYKSHLILL